MSFQDQVYLHIVNHQHTYIQSIGNIIHGGHILKSTTSIKFVKINIIIFREQVFGKEI